MNFLIIDDDVLELRVFKHKFPQHRFDWLPNKYSVNDIIRVNAYDYIFVDVYGVSLGKTTQNDIDVINHPEVYAMSNIDLGDFFTNFISKSRIESFINKVSR